MISFDEARAMVLDGSKPLGVERVVLASALGRTLAHTLKSAVDLPPFDNSLMDGFAIRIDADGTVVNAEYEVMGSIAAGDAPLALASNTAAEIMTGAPMPSQANVVVPIERVTVLTRSDNGTPSRIRIDGEERIQQYIRRRGSDVQHGETVLQAGERITATTLMLAAALGLDPLPVIRKPRVALFNTGRELVDDPKQELLPGQIRNANGPWLEARLLQLGADVIARETIDDAATTLRARLEFALEQGADVIISTGAVSMGRHDFVPEVLRAMGATIVFHTVAQRPGKPLLFAQFDNGSRFFGLPGNPISSVIGLRFYVEPLLRQMLGQADEKAIRAPLDHAVEKSEGWTLLQKARLRVDHLGQLRVSILPGQESFKIAPLQQANALVLLPASMNQVAAGEWVQVYPLESECGFCGLGLEA